MAAIRSVLPNEAAIKALPVPPDSKAVYWLKGKVEGRDVPRGVGVYVTSNGVKAFFLNYRFDGKQRRDTIGRWPEWSVVAAVREARVLRQRIDKADDPLAAKEAAREVAKPKPEQAPEKTIASVLDDFLTGHVEKRSRRPYAFRHALMDLVKPAIGTLPIYGVRRSQIAEMLDGIEANNGPVAADRALTALSSAFNWYAGRDDDFAVPRLKGLKRATGRSRERVLNDDELRLIWRAASWEEAGLFGAMVRFYLLTAQRKEDVAGMEWTELDDKAVWTIPASRYKTGREHSIPLARDALAIIQVRPRIGKLVFTNNGKHLSTNGHSKMLFDKRVTKANGGKSLPNWTLHDLRRTARTLMARAKVRPDVAERVVGHVIRGIEGIYDRYTYEADKRAALEALSRLITCIIDPQPGNVVELAAVR